MYLGFNVINYLGFYLISKSNVRNSFKSEPASFDLGEFIVQNLPSIALIAIGVRTRVQSAAQVLYHGCHWLIPNKFKYKPKSGSNFAFPSSQSSVAL